MLNIIKNHIPHKNDKIFFYLDRISNENGRKKQKYRGKQILYINKV